MAKRNIIKIDRDTCVGCGQCVNACVGGALAMVDGKAQLVRDDYCDGLGVCIGECPVGALTVEEQDAATYAGPANAHPVPTPTPAPAPSAGGCPGMANRTLSASSSGCPGTANHTKDATGTAARGASALTHWPIQLHLANPAAPQFQGANLLVAASCTAFACGDFHADLLSGKGLVIACPKLDVRDGYVEKLTAFFRESQVASITVARMEVPCCMGLTQMVLEAHTAAGVETSVTEVIVGIEGGIQKSQHLAGVPVGA